MGQSTEETAAAEEQFFTLWTVFKRSPATGASGSAANSEADVAAFDALTKSLAERHVTLRGL